jgi:hypothetical protein
LNAELSRQNGTRRALSESVAHKGKLKKRRSTEMATKKTVKLQSSKKSNKIMTLNLGGPSPLRK